MTNTPEFLLADIALPSLPSPRKRLGYPPPHSKSGALKVLLVNFDTKISTKN